jgi:hypothetical protein
MVRACAERAVLCSPAAFKSTEQPLRRIVPDLNRLGHAKKPVEVRWKRYFGALAAVAETVISARHSHHVEGHGR